jgi:hypothetical protein
MIITALARKHSCVAHAPILKILQELADAAGQHLLARREMAVGAASYARRLDVVGAPGAAAAKAIACPRRDARVPNTP